MFFVAECPSAKNILSTAAVLLTPQMPAPSRPPTPVPLDIANGGVCDIGNVCTFKNMKPSVSNVMNPSTSDVANASAVDIANPKEFTHLQPLKAMVRASAPIIRRLIVLLQPSTIARYFDKRQHLHSIVNANPQRVNTRLRPSGPIYNPQMLANGHVRQLSKHVQPTSERNLSVTKRE